MRPLRRSRRDKGGVGFGPVGRSGLVRGSDDRAIYFYNTWNISHLKSNRQSKRGTQNSDQIPFTISTETEFLAVNFLYLTSAVLLQLGNKFLLSIEVRGR